MSADGMYNEVLLDHVANPDHNHEMPDATLSHEGINPSCGDELELHVRMGDDGRIAEASWTGTGCAISQASADMASDLMIGMTPEEARDACALFERMIRGEETDPDVLEDGLDEASCLASISRMPARVKCAELAWRTLDEMLSDEAPSQAATTETVAPGEGA
jgi:nitrogen fixation NifU-like protein